MFPNPQDALPLPPKPNLEQYKKLAKELVHACRAGTPQLGEWAAEWVRTLVRLHGTQFSQGLPVEVESWIRGVTEFATRKLLEGERECALTDAQFVIARSHGFTSWPKLVEFVEGIARGASVSDFEQAADAIVFGDEARLERLLRRPGLARERSAREHRATLLHYVSANGVEGYRQRTPENIVAIAAMLLRAGAEVDAVCEVYGGDCTALGLVATSVHPERAGVQEALMQLLLDHGAALDAAGSAGHKHSLVFACLANGRPKAAKFLAQRGAPLDLETAAGVGNLELVRSFFDREGKLKPPATEEQLQRGFIWACGSGEDEIVEFLLDHGADLRQPAGLDEPPLHMAVVGGRVSTVKLLLARGAPTEDLNSYGGTALGQAGYSFRNGDAGRDDAAIFEALLAAGAKMEDGWLEWLESVQTRSAADKLRVAEVLRRSGATNGHNTV